MFNKKRKEIKILNKQEMLITKQIYKILL